MAKSVRLDPELRARLERASRQSGESQSEFIRRAVDERCLRVLRGPDLRQDFERIGALGAVDSSALPAGAGHDWLDDEYVGKKLGRKRALDADAD